MLFEYVVADTDGQIVFNGDATDADELGVGEPAYRLPLNGWQIEETTPPLLTVVPCAGTTANYDFIWNSKPDKVYDLVSSTTLSAPISTWAVWNGQADLVSTPPTNALTNVPGGGDPQRFFALVEKNSPVLLNADFEHDNGGFFAVGTPNDWAWGIPNSDNGAGLVLTTGNSGSKKCWGTNLGDGGVPSGLINVGVYSILRSPPIDFRGVTKAELRFAAAVDAGNFDSVWIEIVEVGTEVTLDILYPITVPKSEGWASFGPLDISVAAGKIAYIQFLFAGSEENRLGLYIDDVVVTRK
ncbi:MAG: hypothetical protein GX456_03370 [Verrucomicrobia bacterium]|nr:hypothetical protein [Verrucomicrobiota bacterium]